MSSNHRKTVLITGASTGLGLAISKTLIETDKFHVILTARESSIVRFKNEGISESEYVWIRPLEIKNLVQDKCLICEIDAKLNGVDVLINNAGFFTRAVLEHVKESERLEQMHVNFRFPLELIRLVLPKMREKQFGRIINISSVLGMMAMPTMAIYNASKFALEGASESLWYEVRPWNISVTLFQPGFINSSGFQKVKMTGLSEKSYHDKSAPYHKHYRSIVPLIEKLMRRTPTTPDKLAKKILKIIESKNPPLRVSGSFDATFFTLLRRLLPRGLYHFVLYHTLPNIREWGPENKINPDL